MQRIHEHYHERLTITDIAQKAGVSPSHLSRLFQQTLGTSPMKYLERTRMNQARRLLLNTHMRVSEVASEVGFEDPLHFSRAFHRVFGESPRACRT